MLRFAPRAAEHGRRNVLEFIRRARSVPALPVGTYRLEVRASFSDNGDIRTGTLEAALTVS